MNNPSNPISLIYIFSFSVQETTEKKAIKASLPTVKKCELFAESLSIICSCDHFGMIDKELNIRVIFNIKGTQNDVLMKVSSLFGFAASIQLRFVNQEFLTK